MERIRIVFVGLLLAGCFLVAGPVSPAVAQGKTEFRIDGAKLLFSRVEPWAQAFAKGRADAEPVIMGSKTGKGYRGWLAGKVDIVAASREMTPEELREAQVKGYEPHSRLVGWVPLAVMVNSKNPIKSLTLEQLRKIFVGEVSNWKEVGGLNEEITVTTRAVPETGTGLLFQRNVLQGAPYAKGHLVMPLFGTTAKIVGNKIGAVGYIPTTSPSYKRRGVKPIGIQRDDGSPAMMPTEGPSRETDFPVTIPFLLVWDGKSPKAGLLEAFADFSANQVK